MDLENKQITYTYITECINFEKNLAEIEDYINNTYGNDPNKEIVSMSILRGDYEFQAIFLIKEKHIS